MKFIPYQVRVWNWFCRLFPIPEHADKRLPRERAMRFLEEAIELVQAMGLSEKDVNRLADHVFSRPVGEITQEVGGVMVTLAALCSSSGLSLMTAAEAELVRINTPEMFEKIRERQRVKPV